MRSLHETVVSFNLIPHFGNSWHLTFLTVDGRGVASKVDRVGGEGQIFATSGGKKNFSPWERVRSPEEKVERYAEGA